MTAEATDRRLRTALIALCAVGIAIATYLVYIHYAGIKPICAASGGCEIVQSSKWAKFVGIPVADIGLAGYLTIMASLLFLKGELNRLVPMCLALGGLAFTAYLKYAEFVLIKNYCIWCIASAIIMLCITVLTVWRYVRAPPQAAPAAAAAG